MSPRDVSSKTTTESPGLSYPRDAPKDSSAGERELLLSQNIGKDIEAMTKLQVFAKYSQEVAQGNAGILLVVGSEAFFAVMEATAKFLQKVDPPVTALQILIIRMTITYIGCMIYMHIAKIPDPFLGPKGVRLLLIMRGVGGTVGAFGIYYSLRYLSLSDTTVLTFLAPTCTAIAGAVFLGERLKLREGIAGFVSFAGVVLIAHPAAIFGEHDSATVPSPRDRVAASDRTKAVVVSLIGVLGTTLAFTSIRAIGKRAHPMHAIVSFSTVCVTIASIGMVVTKSAVVIPTRLDWLALLVLIGVFGIIAQVLLTMGLQRETASRAALAVYSKIIFATILERMLFHTLPTYLSVVGTLMIVVSALYIVLTKGKTKAKINQSIHLPESDDATLEEGLAPSSSRP